MPLYPTEDIIWNENIVPTEYFSGEGCLALPKLNLQFLTLHDYLLRNFNLFRLESTYEIRQDIEDSVFRMKPWKGEDGGVVFGGWARMAQPITAFSVVEVGKPNIGEKQPSRVRADVSVILDVRNDVKSEWESLRKHDACFLITVRPPGPPGTHFNFRCVVDISFSLYEIPRYNHLYYSPNTESRLYPKWVWSTSEVVR